MSLIIYLASQQVKMEMHGNKKDGLGHLKHSALRKVNFDHNTVLVSKTMSHTYKMKLIKERKILNTEIKAGPMSISFVVT